MSLMFTLICVLISVAFFTLLERKTLSYLQWRKGPNKVSTAGLPQPIADAVKLFIKQMSYTTKANQKPYYLAPTITIIVAILLWQTMPYSSSSMFLSWGILLLICLSALNVYGTLLAGWSSNSKFALIGALRGVTQTISYEVTLALILLSALLFSRNFMVNSIPEALQSTWLVFLAPPTFLLWFTSCLAETNRAPFDFSEGESELVSGFNIEYGSATFAMIFLAEYANIIFMSMLTAIIFTGDSNLFLISSPMILIIKSVSFCFIFVWVRGSLPRLRYDRLMHLAWKSFLPFILSALTVMFMIQTTLFT
uniref:NADH-ubiquinone oxidoreductase chain 1 n=1 Tax=Paralepetopsis sp. TaxID=3071116 RepID=A0AA96HSV7_9GAST|nr:NADH dehydrogenase subunit 1 [Paralepetopsis sp.]